MTNLAKLQVDDVLKDRILEALRTDIVTVRFTKADGTERDMRCTLVESKIPTDRQPKNEAKATDSVGSAVRVFDTEKGEWRSFRWESLISVEGITQ